MTRAACAAFLLLVAGCDVFSPPPAPPVLVASVLFLPDSGTVISGETLQLTVFLQDQNGAPLTGRIVHWSSLDSTIALVSGSGLVQGLSAGITHIVAGADSAADTATITVLPVRFTQVGAGGIHSCALVNSGHMACWGYNFYGQAGIGNFAFIVDAPAAVTGGHLFASIAAGGYHSCAVGTDLATYCWGRNSSSQLGRGLLPGSLSEPAAVLTALHFVTVSAGNEHTCALTADSLAYCWGLDAEGQLGDSQVVTTRNTPFAVRGGRPYGLISAGMAHTCALAAGGAAYCWGRDASGQIGDSTTGGARVLPVAVHGGIAFVTVAAADEHTCGLATDSSAYCWGANDRGQLGSGVPGPALTPALVSGGLKFLAIVAGGAHTCGLASDSTAYCWGADDRGQLGDSAVVDQPLPVAVFGGRKFTALSAGRAHTCGLAADAASTLYCWGSNTSAELGTGGARTDSPVPVPVAGQ